jgi:hypothetical protein
LYWISICQPVILCVLCVLFEKTDPSLKSQTYTYLLSLQCLKDLLLQFNFQILLELNCVLDCGLDLQCCFYWIFIASAVYWCQKINNHMLKHCKLGPSIFPYFEFCVIHNSCAHFYIMSGWLCFINSFFGSRFDF